MKRLNGYLMFSIVEIVKSYQQCYIKRLFILFLVMCGMVSNTYSLDEIIKINYEKIVDRSLYTHSGQTVGEVLAQLKTLPPLKISALSPDEDDLFNFDADDEQQKITHEANKILKQVQQHEITEQTASFLLTELRRRKDNISEKLIRKNLSALIEPFLEPYAFLLQDALEADNPIQPKNSLVEVEDLFPYGEKQPAWANLLKTHRYFALSDGKGYVRIFLPEKLSLQGNLSAQQAFSSNYGAVRHILNWLRESSQNKELNVDIYGYHNDFVNQVLYFTKTPYNLKVSDTLQPAKDTIPLDLRSIEDFLAKKLVLDGAYINDQNTLVLYGSKSVKEPTLENKPLELSDFAVAYRAVFYAGYNEPYISLDPSQFPEQVNVNFGGRLADTRIGWVTLRSDMRFKTLSLGLDPITGEDQREQIRNILPDFRTRIERMMSMPTGRQTTSEGTRFWFYPERDPSDAVGGVQTSVSRDEKFFKINSPRFIGKAERQSAFIGERQLEDSTPLWTKNTLAHLNQNYNSFSEKYPELRELDNVGRLLTLFAWLKGRQQAGLKIDFDSLLNVELPECETPRRKSQLAAGLLIKNNVVQKIYNYSLLTQQIADEREINNKNPFLPNDKSKFKQILGSLFDQNLPEDMGVSDKAFTFVGGGIDLNVKTLVNKARKLSPPEEVIYTRIRQSAPNVGIAETPSKRLFRANVKTVEELRASNILPKPQPKQHQAGDTTSIATGIERRSIAAAKREIIDYKPETEKIKWTRNAPEDSFDKQNSKNVFFGSDGKPETFARVEENSQAIYKIGKNGNDFVAEKTVLSKENEVSLINGLSKEGDSDLQIWRSLSETTDIRAFERMSDGSMAILRETSQKGFQLTIHDAEDNIVKTFNGKEAIAEIDKATRIKLEAASNDEVAFVHAAIEGDNFIFQVGKERKQFSSAEMEKVLQDPTSQNAKAFDALFNRQGNFIIYRDAFSRMPERFGESVRYGTIADPMSMMAGLRERFPGKRIFLDDEVDVAKENIRAIESLKKPGDVGLLAPEDSFPVQDHGLVKNVKKNWQAAGGILLENVLQQPDAMRQVPNVLLFSGHNDTNLTSYLVALGEKGLLKGKVLFLNTCFANENPYLNNHLIKKYQPKAVFIHSEKISPAAMELVIDNFSNLLRNAEIAGKTIHPLDLMEESIKLSLKDEDATPNNIEEIKKLRRGTFQVSWIQRAENSKQAE